MLLDIRLVVGKLCRGRIRVQCESLTTYTLEFANTTFINFIADVSSSALDARYTKSIINKI